MADSEFWRDLEARFRALHEEQLQNRGDDAVHALWCSKGFDSSGGNPWFVGGSTDLIRTQFEWLAESAAVRLGHSGGPDAVSSWLDHLKADSPHFRPLESSSMEKGKWMHWNGGRIEFVCKASAEYCLKCETQETVKARIATRDLATRRRKKSRHRKPTKSKGLLHSEDYSSVTMPNGKQFTLTPDQARVIEMLDKAWVGGNPDVNKRSILGRLERDTSRLQDIFRSTPGALKALIKTTRRGVYRLNLPNPPVSQL